MEATYAQVIALMDHLRCEGIQRLVLESTSDYWRIWHYLAEAASVTWNSPGCHATYRNSRRSHIRPAAMLPGVAGRCPPIGASFGSGIPHRLRLTDSFSAPARRFRPGRR